MRTISIFLTLAGYDDEKQVVLSKHKKLNGSVCKRCINLRHLALTKCLALLDLPTEPNPESQQALVAFKGIYKHTKPSLIHLILKRNIIIM